MCLHACGPTAGQNICFCTKGPSTIPGHGTAAALQQCCTTCHDNTGRPRHSTNTPPAPAVQIDLVKGMMDCLYAQCTPCITDCVMAELEKLGQKYRVALKIAKVGAGSLVREAACTCSRAAYESAWLTTFVGQLPWHGATGCATCSQARRYGMAWHGMEHS